MVQRRSFFQMEKNILIINENSDGTSGNGSLAVVISSDPQRKKASGLGSTLSQ